ncbi:MAG: EamA family transporter [Acidobacteriota bacterium]
MALSRRGLDLAGLVLLSLIWGTTWAAIRVAVRGVPPLTGVALRFGFAGLLLLALAKIYGVSLGRAANERPLWLANGLLTFAGSYGIVFWAEQWVPSGLASVLFATFPLWTVVLSPLVLPGERLTWRSGSGVVLGFVGVALIFWRDLAPASDGGLTRLGVAGLVFLIAPLLSATANLLTKRFGAGVHPLSITSIPMLIGAAIVAPLAVLVEHPLQARFDTASLLALAYLAVVGSAIAFTVYYALLRRGSVLELSMITYAAPVVAVAIGVLFFDERLGPQSLLGAGLVLAGVLLTVAVRHERGTGPADGP